MRVAFLASSSFGFGLALLTACAAPSTEPQNSIGLVLTATTALVVGDSGGRVTSTETITNRSQVTRQFTWSEGCPIEDALQLRVYAASGSHTMPVWSWQNMFSQSVCISDIPTTSLAPGASKQFSLSVTVDQILGDSLPPGEYDVTVAAQITPQLLGEIHTGTLSLAP